MIYVFDTSSLANLFRHYYRKRFPSLWKKFDSMVANGNIASVREVQREIQKWHDNDLLKQWSKGNPGIFLTPTNKDLGKVAKIFTVPHFQSLVEGKKRLTGDPVADPFIIAVAWNRDGIVVTEETLKDNAAKIPNVCQNFGVECTNLQGFMERENWQF